MPFSTRKERALAIRQEAIGNRMLAALKPEDFELLQPFLDEAELPAHFIIARPRAKLDYIYFPESGIGAVMTVSPGNKSAEAGMFGSEGFVPTSTIIGDDFVPYLIEMHVAGRGYRVPVEAMRITTGASSSFQVPFIKYMHVFATQVAYTALANARFQVEQRLARWILMCHDRIRSNELNITHEYISTMLGVRRPSVTTALHVLEGNRLIRSSRGAIVVLNRKGLEDFAGGSYGIPEREFERLLG
jgi:CRP-like cAMP-binding protein